MSEITTAEELDALLAVAGEEAEPVVVREDFRVWTLTEDENGQWWAWSWREEGEDGKPRHVESLRLPLLVLYAPSAPAGATVTREAVETLAHHLGIRWERLLALLPGDLGLTVTDTPTKGGGDRG